MQRAPDHQNNQTRPTKKTPHGGTPKLPSGYHVEPRSRLMVVSERCVHRQAVPPKDRHVHKGLLICRPLAWCAWPGLATRSEIHETFIYKIVPMSRAIHVVTARPIVGNRNVKIQDGCVLYKDVGIIRLSCDQNHVSGFGWENSRRKATGVQDSRLKHSPRSRFAIDNNSPRKHQIRSRQSWPKLSLTWTSIRAPRSALARWIFSWEQVNTVNSYKRPVGCVEGISGNLISTSNRMTTGERQRQRKQPL